VFERHQQFMDGRWVAPASGTTIPVISPATEEVVGSVAWGNREDVSRAIDAAVRARRGPWSSMSFEDRADLLERAADRLDSWAQPIGEVITAEVGQPAGHGQALARAAARMIRTAVDCARQVPLRELRQDSQGWTLVQMEPVGVVAALVPFNGPLTIGVLKTAPALLAGCPVVLKPSPQAQLAAFYLADALQAAGLPPGMFNLVTGDQEVGQAMVEHPEVALVSFTGSTEVGRSIARTAGEQLKHVSLELGGKSAGVVLDDADLSVAVPLIGSAFTSAGQYCRALTRVLVPRQRHDEVVDALVRFAASMRLGDPHEAGVNMPPLISASQRERVERYVNLAREEGANVVCGGRRPPYLDKGFYFEPTVITGATNDMRFVREEIFGPVVAVLAYDDVDEAVAIANDSDYGLSGAVFTRDLPRGLDIACRIETGTIGVNQHGARSSAPCGGVKASGIGQEHGPEGYREFLSPKAIMMTPELAEQLVAGGVTVAPLVR
jgi:aldehyde dehydrogenase (NAD+)